MITEQRKKRLKRKIQDSRGRLVNTYPFFALMLMYLKFVANPEIKKMSTDGRCIYFSPDFVDKLYDRELDYVLCHQIMHIINEHIWRPFDRCNDNFHFACDISINAELYKIGFTDEKYPHLGEIYTEIPVEKRSPNQLTPEEIYELLPYSLYIFDERTRGRFLVDNDVCWGRKDGIRQSEEIIIDIYESENLLRDAFGKSGNATEDGEGLQAEWAGRAASAIKSAKVEKNEDANSIGNVPDSIKRIIEKMKEPVIDWRKILNIFVQEQVCDYSFSPPDRRFSDTGFFLPDFNEKEFISKEILFMVDTSGSIEDEDLAIVYSEIKGAVEQFSGKIVGKLGFFDDDVTPPLPFENVDDLMQIIPYGGGGTDFRVIFDYVRKNYSSDLPSSIVIFTDGEGPFPTVNETMGIPVLWILNNLSSVVPFGKTVRILPGVAENKK